jgi:hypothetical protein
VVERPLRPLVEHLREVLELLVELVAGHLVSRRHQSIRLDVRERVEVSADLRERPLHADADPVVLLRRRLDRRALVELGPVGLGARVVGLPAPVGRRGGEALLEVHDHQPPQRAGPAPAAEVGELGPAHATHQDAVGPVGDAQQAAARVGALAHLPARVADEHDRALLLDEARDPLVVVHAAVHELHADAVVDAVELDRWEQAGHAR